MAIATQEQKKLVFALLDRGWTIRQITLKASVGKTTVEAFRREWKAKLSEKQNTAA